MPAKTTDHYDSLMKKLKVVRDRVRGVVHGTYNGLYLYGRPGTSKSYTVCTTLEALGVQYVYKNGHMRPGGLFDLLERNPDKVIVLDDVSSLFGQPVALQLLLAALGNRHDGSGVRLIGHTTAHGDRTVPFTGGVICLSNLPLAAHRNEVLKALTNRVFMIEYAPTDEEMAALLGHIADKGVRGLTPTECHRVLSFLLDQMKARDIQPTVRQYVDKALADYELFKSKKCETHWKDLIVSDLEQSMVELQHPTTDLSRAEQVEADQRIALSVYLSFETRVERVQEWKNRTGKSQPVFYRRLAELREAGKLPADASPVEGD